ncbi:hypothetical protein LIER_21944 [Lithospermum erythrorhizon]|uniref:Uncharacterized protein n=1 Tax=Lithospermum erythrorhizon TaxID=34254 RepID=A0AAV3QT48_LITER
MKRGSYSEASASVSKCAKLEALANTLAVSVRLPKAILPLLAKSGANSKKSKGKSVSAQGEGSSLDCYSDRYMKAPYSLRNGLSIEEGHLWNNRIEAFHAVHPFLFADEGRKHPSSGPMDALSLFSLYMIRLSMLNMPRLAVRR